jgi:ribonuclease BN (tRNA processing enzyme)
MHIRMLASSVGVENPELQYLSSYLINDTVAVDAGPLGVHAGCGVQVAVRHLFLTHTHIDHIATLPLFIENTFVPGGEPVTIYGHPESLSALQKHVFNDVIWPDFVRLSHPGREFLRLCPIAAETALNVEGLSILPVLVDHPVVTYGYIVTDGASTVAFGADSGPTDRIWQLLSARPAPRSVFLECCYPNSMAELAHIAGHLTPAMFGAEVAKMPETRTIVAIHIKPRFRKETLDEILALGIPNLVIGTPDAEYDL